MNLNEAVILCSDLDRTLIPNGSAPESPAARPMLLRLAAHPDLTLVYVSGRDLALIQQAISDYQLPVPDWAIGDVGTSLYQVTDGAWQICEDWSAAIAPDWSGQNSADLASQFSDLPGLRLQEAEKQKPYKLSYYTAMQPCPETLLAAIRERLQARNLHCNLIWSIDEAAGQGLLDILPASANKHAAIEFLLQRQNLPRERTVFAGDSGNDRDVLVSGLRAILVGNAEDSLRTEVHQAVQAAGYPERLYSAHGSFAGMNGHYAAGVLEGVAHFFPHTQDWIGLDPFTGQYHV